MVNQESGKLEWGINLNDGSTETLVTEHGFLSRLVSRIKGWVIELFILKFWRFLKKAWRIGVAEPKKVIHGLKVGSALSVVSLFYYVRPLYDGVGRNAMWAIMTVVVVFESTVGATFSKCINRVAATLLAGSLGIGVHWIATQSGEKLEPIVTGVSVFLFASAATFSRFVPSVKARFDYGAMIFILTFSLVSVSGYRVDQLIALAHQRASTIAIGASICILISMLFCPIWAGYELHHLVHRNLEKLADSLDGCIAEYFKENEALARKEEHRNEKIQGYKCVINSKATEESLANFARWEPAHGRFNFRHPWKQYLKIGASMRRCAYCIENLSSCVNSEIQAPLWEKKRLEDASLKLSSASSKILRELVVTMKNMIKSSKTDFLVNDMNFALQELQETLKLVPLMVHEVFDQDKLDHESKITLPPLLEVLPLASLASLLIENASRIQGVVEAIDELANLAEFEPDTKKTQKQNQPINGQVLDNHYGA